jgi:hypothetical protein
MKHFLIVLIALFSSLAVAQQELRPNVQYPSGSSVKSSYFGVSLNIPAGFVGGFSDDGMQALAVAQPGQNLVIVAILQHGVSRAEYMRTLSQPLPLSAELTLQPNAQPQEQGSSLSNAYSSVNGVSARLVAIRGQTGSSVLVMGIAFPGLEGPMQQGVQRLVSSLKFVAPQAVQGSAQLRSQWTSLIAGRVWSSESGSFNSSVNGSGGTSSSTQVTLCQNKSFSILSQSSVFVSVPGFSGSGSDASSIDENRFEGRWSLEFVTASSAVLALTDENGLQRRFVLTLRGNQVFSNNTPWTPRGAGC